MERYTDQATAPLRFHNLNKFVIMPLNVVFLLIRTINLLRAGSFSTWLGCVDLAYYAASLALAAGTFVGFVRWRSYGPACFLSYVGLTVAYDVLALVLHILYQTDAVAASAGTVIGSLLFAALMFLYYGKRRPLFR